MKNENKFYNSLMVKMGFLLHKRFGLHLLILFVINLFSAVIIAGMSNAFRMPLITYKLVAFLLFVIVSTLIEVILKVFVLRHFISLLFKTWGLLTLIIQVLIFMMADLIVDQLSFNQTWLISILIFTITFYIVRVMIIIIYQKYILKYIIGGDKNGSNNKRNN